MNSTDIRHRAVTRWALQDGGAESGTPDADGEPFGRLDLALTIGGGAAVVGLAATTGPLMGVAGLAVALYLVACLRHPPLIGYTLIAVVPVASGLARGMPIPGVRLTEFMSVAAAAVVLPRALARSPRPWQALDWAAFGYVACHIVLGGFSGTLHGSLNAETLGLLVGPLQYFLMYRVIVYTLDTPERRARALRILLVMVAPASVLAIVQYLGVPGVQAAVQQLTGTDVFDLYTYEFTRRATGPFASWHPLAGYLFIPIVVAAAIGMQARSKVLGRRAAWAVVAFGVTALVVSQTLNVLAGSVVCVVLVAVLQGTSRRIVYAFLAVSLVAVATFWPVLGQRVDAQRVEDPLAEDSVALPQTIQYRLDVWQEQYVPAVLDHGLVGYGPDLPPEITWRSTESLYFTLLLRGGVALLGAFAVLMFVAARDSWRLRHSRDDAERALGLGLLAVILALVPMQAVFPYFTASGLPQVFWAALGLIGGASATAPTTQRPQDALGPDPALQEPTGSG